MPELPEIPMEKEQTEQQALLQARVEIAQRKFGETERQLAGATDAAQRTIWEHRLNQSRQELEEAQVAAGIETGGGDAEA